MKQIIAIIFALMLMACSQLKEGTVVGKKYKPAHEETTYYVVGNGALVPTSNTYSEEFILVIEGKNKDGKTIREYHAIDPFTWKDAKIGDHWTDAEE